MSQLENFRREVDEFFKNHPQSPLEPEQQADFAGLDYYEPNDDLVLEVEVERYPDDEPIVVMQTSTGDAQEFRPWGTFDFEVDSEKATLTIYADPHGHDFFMPFRDATSGHETYGAGRYMDDHRPALEYLGGSRLKVDFNYAYNPYCAYSEFYSCPLPPHENWLRVPIRAGEKKFE
jgi:hypothetical protein